MYRSADINGSLPSGSTRLPPNSFLPNDPFYAAPSPYAYGLGGSRRPNYYGGLGPYRPSPYHQGVDPYDPSYRADFFSDYAMGHVRSALGPLSSFISTVENISYVLGSSYDAIMDTIHATVQLVDNFSSLGRNLKTFVQTMSVLNALKALLCRLLRLLGVAVPASLQPNLSDVWKQTASVAAGGTAADVSAAGASQSRQGASALLSSLAFLLMFVGPYLIWRLVSRLMPSSNNRDWIRGVGKHYTAKATQDYQCPHSGFAFFKDDLVRIAPKELQPRPPAPGLVFGSNQQLATGWIPTHMLVDVKLSELSTVEIPKALAGPDLLDNNAIPVE